jgi:hypothetical protein
MTGLPLLHVAFSGGRTSAFMTKKLLDNWSDRYQFCVTFANTGLEHEKTLQFVHNCDKYFGFNTVWLEADVNPLKGEGTSFKIVTFETAKRNGEPFEEMIKKYGIPNSAYLHCTRELKLLPMQKYLKHVGFFHKEVPTALGIRADERRRVRSSAEANNIIYPLVDTWPVDKQDVLDWWEDQTFDLDIEEWDGNCKGCYKKSFKKLFKQLDSDPSVLDWHEKMESLYAKSGANKTGEYERVFFRGNTSAVKVKEMWKNDRDSPQPFQTVLGFYEDSGCSESCEVYDTK